ncbi:MAG: hypothetical protein IT449_10445 [Phycisphaerales bacterium]|nr:hypothetical protein [Phycisphaerales bacterium]
MRQRKAHTSSRPPRSAELVAANLFQPRRHAIARSSVRLVGRLVAATALLNLGLPRPSSAQEYVSETVHNLSVSGPGGIRASSERQVCIFCHAPHNTGGMRPLWNRQMPVSNYRIYRSSTLDARPGQPTGSSKLCLSCHDGTIALGSVLSRADRIQMRTEDFIPAGLTNLGTDLSDDHPVSFFYTSGIANTDRQLVDPHAIPDQTRLDPSGQLQCTSCHDAHHNLYGNFLVLPEQFGELCLACHKMDGWEQGAHQHSSVSVAATNTVDWPFDSVAANACRSCHRSHTAGGHERLLLHEEEEANCLNCHDGRIAASNLRGEIDKPSAHDPRRWLRVHDPAEGALVDAEHVECADCHNPHAVESAQEQSPLTTIGGTLSRVAGFSAEGLPVATARHEYEVCFRCHAETAVQVRRGIARQAQSANLRLKFGPTSPSFHPVVVSSGGTETVSLAPGISRGTTLRCTDCHNNDSGPRAGGSGPDGPHGSVYPFLLERNYTTTDDTVESDFAYAMCYKCHQRSSLLADESFPLHRLHVVEARTPCSACHDPHGIAVASQSVGSDHTHLINFDTTLVRPAGPSRRIQFQDLGRFAGSCTMTCHGKTHIETAYGR